ncbi:MAG: RNB domain-containing ribonuclease [Burkholderiales bacterium]|nr:RNB domain-containing ribonuclease [Burkholderiales bacterium]
MLYEDGGEFRVGTVLAQSPASLQVETLHGRRAKVKSASVVMQFERPAGAELMSQAQRYADGLDTDFLWQCSAGREFDFRELAREYVGRDPTAVEATGLLLKLHAAPMYFYRRGRGRFQAAPEETLQRAIAGMEKKRRVQAQIEAWTEALAQGRCAPEIAALKDELLYAPDRNKPETKAFEQACKQTGLSAARLLERCGLLTDSYAYHLNAFLHEFFPRGTQFPAHPAPALSVDLPIAEHAAFSLDDVGTTEIDDAFSVARSADGSLRIGVHIAAPALGFAPGSAIDGIARERMSTAYMPGEKFTMLPDEVIEFFSLDHGASQPAVSLYIDVSPEDLSVRGHRARLERIPIAANLHHAQYDRLNDAFPAGSVCGLPFEEDLRTLWRFACALEARRGKPAVGGGFPEYTISVRDGHVEVRTRKRGAPLDKLVAELMIFANAAWGMQLAERDVAAIYRVQTSGKVRMSVHPEAHEGLGVSCYAWSTSPLRRYVDLVNQWQLVAVLEGRRAPFGRSAETLLSAMRAFEVVHARFSEHQRAMESYWCLRWLLQERVEQAEAVVLRDRVVRFAALPLTVAVPSLPTLEPGTRVRIAVGEIDLIERSVACSYRETLSGDAEGVPNDTNAEA